MEERGTNRSNGAKQTKTEEVSCRSSLLENIM